MIIPPGIPWWQVANQLNTENAMKGAYLQEEAARQERAAVQQQAARQDTPISPPMPPRQVGYDQPPAALLQRRNKRMLLVGTMSGSAVAIIMAYVAIEISLGIGALVSAYSKNSEFLFIIIVGAIAVVIVGAIGAIVGAIVGAISLVVIRIIAGKQAFNFIGVEDILIATVAGIACAIGIVVVNILTKNSDILHILAVIAVIVGTGVIAGALVAWSVDKKY